jgi:hypothetical protein
MKLCQRTNQNAPLVSDMYQTYWVKTFLNVYSYMAGAKAPCVPDYEIILIYCSTFIGNSLNAIFSESLKIPLKCNIFKQCQLKCIYRKTHELV